MKYLKYFENNIDPFNEENWDEKDYIRNGNDIENNFINAWKPLFDEYPDLNALPIYAWGRYYKYELAGEPFESYIDEDGFNGFKHMNIKDNLDWKLLEDIDKKYNVRGGKIWIGELGDYLPDRRDVVHTYNFDSRGGKCLVIKRNENGNLEVDCVDCDSPE